MGSPRLIDGLHLGRDRVIGAWLREGAIVDPGPSTCLEALLAGLGGERPRALLLTHIHLDHAGAAGSLVQRFPDLRVYVHELGAPHVIDPERLLASAERLYGERLGELWGEVLPVPADRVVPLSGGELVEGLRVLHAPGHAAHHVCYLDEGSGDAFVGDVAGIRIPPSEVTVMPTPPPEIDVVAWEASLAALTRWDPQRLLITHFGALDEPARQLAAAGESLARQAELARSGDRERFVGELSTWTAGEPEVTERLTQAITPEQSWLGLERYWRKRAG